MSGFIYDLYLIGVDIVVFNIHDLVAGRELHGRAGLSALNPSGGSHGDLSRRADRFLWHTGIGDPDADQVLTYAVTGQPSHGTVTIDPQSGQAVYTPQGHYDGPDTFTFTVTGGGSSHEAGSVTSPSSSNSAGAGRDTQS